MTNLINLTDLQFTGSDDTSNKLRRLVQDLVAAERAVNALILAVSDLSDNSTTSVDFSDLKFSGLTSGQVLTALTATSAAFKALNLEGLSDTAISSPVDGDVLTYFHGQWIAGTLPAAAKPPAGTNIGTGAGIYEGISGGNLAFKSIQGDGATIGVTFTSDTITLSFIGGAITGPQGLMGPPGMDGQDGDDGIMGPPGIQGPSGGGGGGGTDVLGEATMWRLAPVIWGGKPTSIYGGVLGLDFGIPSTIFTGLQSLDCSDNRVGV